MTALTNEYYDIRCVNIMCDNFMKEIESYIEIIPGKHRPLCKKCKSNFLIIDKKNNEKKNK